MFRRVKSLSQDSPETSHDGLMESDDMPEFEPLSASTKKMRLYTSEDEGSESCEEETVQIGRRWIPTGMFGKLIFSSLKCAQM